MTKKVMRYLVPISTAYVQVGQNREMKDRAGRAAAAAAFAQGMDRMGEIQQRPVCSIAWAYFSLDTGPRYFNIDCI
jgi:hypothetical protein